MIPANWFILDEALDELADATEWYEENARGGHLLLDAVAHTIEVLARDPEISTAVAGARQRVRRRRVEGFPYAVVFEKRGQEYAVLAIEHAKRRPGYWKRRR